MHSHITYILERILIIRHIIISNTYHTRLTNYVLYDIFITFTQLVTTTDLLVDYPIAIRYHYCYIVLNTTQRNSTQCWSVHYYWNFAYYTITTLKATHSLILVDDSLVSSWDHILLQFIITSSWDKLCS